MGVIKRGILGGFSGSVGNIVGSSWKGIDVMKSKPLSVANPKTAAQVAQRTKFTAMVQLAALMLVQIVKPLWDRFAQRESGYNAMVSFNIDAFDGSGVLTPADFQTSNGSLLPAAITTIDDAAAQDEVTLNWVDNSGTGNAQATDNVYSACWNATQDVWAFGPNTEARSAEVSVITMPANLVAGDVLHCYLAFRKADGTLVSDSDYKTQTV